MASLPVSAKPEVAALLAAYDTQLRGRLINRLSEGVRVERPDRFTPGRGEAAARLLPFAEAKRPTLTH
jgi:hypothetical protein